MDFKPGEKIRFLNDVGGGKIIRIEGDIAFVEDENGFEIPVNVKELIYADPDFEKQVMRMDAEVDYHKKGVSSPNRKTSSGISPSGTFKQQASRDTILEVDLHAHVLFENTTPEPYRVLRLQLQQVERMLEQAMRDKYSKMIIIHGKGEGTLKNEVWKLLRFYPNLSFEEASYQNYGMGGATLVRFRYS